MGLSPATVNPNLSWAAEVGFTLIPSRDPRLPRRLAASSVLRGAPWLFQPEVSRPGRWLRALRPMDLYR